MAIAALANGNYQLAFSEEQTMLLDSARDFCRDKSSISQVRALLDDNQGFDSSAWQEQVALGWSGVAIPETLGGSELGLGATVAIAETMGRHLHSTPFFSVTLAAQALLRAGTASQQQTWLPELAAGKIATLALLDNGDWGDTQLACQATAQGDGWQLQGSKQLVTDAHVAELFIVSLSIAGQPALALVSTDKLGANAIRPQQLIDQTKRAAQVDFSGVTITNAELLDSTKAPATLRDLKLIGALLTAAEATGSTAACLDTIVEYLKTRKQFGKQIGAYQALKHPAVDILIAMDSARSLIYHAASIVEPGPLSSDSESACRMAKAQASEALLFAGDRAVQFHGGMGFTYECDAQLYIRRAQWMQQHFGDAEHHRRRLAALLLD